MANSYQRFLRINGSLQDNKMCCSQIQPDTSTPLPPYVPLVKTPERLTRRWELLNASTEIRQALGFIEQDFTLRNDQPENNIIENFIGFVKVPVGLAGPLRINGIHAKGDFYIPLATIEPTLVATYNRGAQVISRCGGCTCLILDEGVIRSPGFEFSTLAEAAIFSSWATSNFLKIKETADSTTRFGSLLEMKVRINGNYVHLIFEYTTGDAIGQNMVTIATDAILKYIVSDTPVKPVFFTIDANMSGDKKACAQTFQSVRGRKVSADVIIPRDICLSLLNTSPEALKRYVEISYIGAFSSGTLGAQGHYANGLTALYIACGQDAACASESAVGITCVNVTKQGDLYASVTLPNIMVGTIGAVSALPSQKACLELLGLYGPGMAPKLAELCAGLCLAGELSMCAALSANEFTGAHKKLARGKKS
jgi:hydroxymethylglutaryl-CoA reductase (NADPH)